MIRFNETHSVDELLARPQTQENGGAQSEGQVDEQQRKRVAEPQPEQVPETQSAPLSAAIPPDLLPACFSLFTISAERLAAVCAASPSNSSAEPISHQRRTLTSHFSASCAL